jgi:peptidyl-prolyl cis-trans isomerase SurA
MMESTMHNHTQRIITGLVTIGASLALAQPAQAQPLVSDIPGAVVLERILVKVNGGLVTQTALENAQISALRVRGAPPQTDAELRRVIEEITPGLIVNAVEERLLVQRARDLGYSLSDEQFQDILDGIKEENNMNDEQLVATLEADEGMTLPELRVVMERQMLVSQVQQVEILGRVSITDTEASEYYDTHLEEFTEPATVTLQEILIAVPAEGGALNVARDNQARAAAEAARTRVLAGDDFGQVASEVSDAASEANGGLIGPIALADLAESEVSDAASEANGGLIGPIALADLAESVRERIEALEVGEVGEVERTTAGYQILKLASATQPTPTPFDDVRQGILDNVFNERRLRALADYLNKLRDEAIIEWKDEGLKSLYDESLANRNSTTGG